MWSSVSADGLPAVAPVTFPSASTSRMFSGERRLLSRELAVIAIRRGSRFTTALKFPLVPSAQPRIWNSRPSCARCSEEFIGANYNTAVSTEKVRGRGASSNPRNRFEKMSYETSEWDEPGDPSRHTIFLRDETRSIINYNDSPDVGFNASINPYRGSEHGCIYWFARPNHEYLGFSAGLDFESKILVKQDAPELLRRELASPRWEPQVIAISGVTDAYQPIERRLKLTRRCLEVLAEFRNPVVIITKNELVTRDIDLLSTLATLDGVLVFVSVTSLDGQLARELEPRASYRELRLAAIKE